MRKQLATGWILLLHDGNKTNLDLFTNTAPSLDPSTLAVVLAKPSFGHVQLSGKLEGYVFIGMETVALKTKHQTRYLIHARVEIITKHLHNLQPLSAPADAVATADTRTTLVIVPT